jgi:WD40 repeat protein
VLDARWLGRTLHRLHHDSVAQHVNGVSAQWCHAARTMLLTGSDDGLMRVWDVALGGQHPMVACLPGHSAPISCVAVSPDDDLFASGGDDGKIVAYSTGISASGSRYSVGTEQDNFLTSRA